MDRVPMLVLLPGLGADERQFWPQHTIPARLQVARWPEPESRNETLAHYATRMADAIAPRLPADLPLYVGGLSLGAMAALEMARLLSARGVFLIGGCTSYRQITPIFRAVLVAGATMPARWVRPALAVAPLAFRLFERLTPEHRRLMTRLLREHSPEQTRWSCRAILGWECCALPPQVPVHAIHGAADEVIPATNVRPEQLVPGGRHLISLSHAEQVNRFIDERLRT